jgi:hypothetical protein
MTTKWIEFVLLVKRDERRSKKFIDKTGKDKKVEVKREAEAWKRVKSARVIEQNSASDWERGGWKRLCWELNFIRREEKCSDDKLE